MYFEIRIDIQIWNYPFFFRRVYLRI